MARTGTTTESTLDEFSFSTGEVHWTAEGPRGKLWSIVWQPQREGRNMRAWPFPAGGTRYFAAASDIETARSEAKRIAGLIQTGEKG